MSSTWLSWLATWFKPVLEALRQLLIDLYVFPICLALGIGVGAFHILWHGRRGHGTAIILSAFAIGMLGLWLTRDPLGDLTGNDGLINQARTLGFSVAQAATNNGPITGGGATGQLGHLTSVLADAMLRAPLQIWNFGTTIDSIGSCGHDWSAAIMSGVRDAPAHAMQSCGAPQALHYAQSIDGSVFALGIGFCLLGLFFTLFVTYVTYSYIMVCGAALLNALMAIFAVGPAMIHGAPRRRARRRLEQFFRHAFLVFIYVLYICVAALIILRTVAPAGLASEVGMTNPVAMLVLVALFSAVATGVFWYLKREILHDHTRQDLVQTVRQAIHLGKSGYQRGQDKLTQGRDLADKARQRFSQSPGGGGAQPGTTFTQPSARRKDAVRATRARTGSSYLDCRHPNGSAQRLSVRNLSLTRRCKRGNEYIRSCRRRRSRCCGAGPRSCHPRCDRDRRGLETQKWPSTAVIRDTTTQRQPPTWRWTCRRASTSGHPPGRTTFAAKTHPG
jgi:hypothetical protein